VNPQGTQVAQLVKRLTLDFGSGHNVRVVEPHVRLHIGCGTCLRFSLSLCMSLSLSLLKKIKLNPQFI